MATGRILGFSVGWGVGSDVGSDITITEVGWEVLGAATAGDGASGFVAADVARQQATCLDDSSGRMSGGGLPLIWPYGVQGFVSETLIQNAPFPSATPFTGA